MSKWRIPAAVALALAVPLAAAGRGEQSTQLETDRPVDLVVTFAGDSMKLNAFEKVAYAYMQQYPNVTVRLNPIPGGEYNTRVLSMIQTGAGPDVIDINSPLYFELDEQLLDLTESMKNAGYFDETKGLYPGWFDMLAGDGHYDTGERLFQAPMNSGTTVLAYNKRLFDQAGIRYPTPDWSWDEDFLEAARSLSDPENGIWGVNGVNRGFVHHAVVAAYGGQFFDFSTSQPTFRGNETQAVEALQFLHDLIYEYKAAPTPAQQDEFGGSGVGMFEEGHAAMYFLNTFEFPSLYKFEDEWDIVPLPRGPSGRSATTIYGDRLAVWRHSRNPDHAWEYIKLLNSEVGQEAFDTYFGFGDPALQSVADNYVFSTGRVGAPENNNYRVETLKTQTAMINPMLPDNEVFAELEDQLQLLWQNETTAKGAMDAAATQIEPILSNLQQ